MYSCRLRILHSLINKNYITIIGNRHSIFKTNKWYSTTANSSEINFETKQHESCSSVLSSENCGCAGAKEHQETPSTDPPLILSVRPYPKSTMKELSKQPFQTANDKSVTSIDSASTKPQTHNGNCVKSSIQPESKCDEIIDICEVPKHKDGDCPWSLKEIEKKYAVCRIIQSYQMRGYLAAKVDPLGIQEEIVDLENRNYKPPQNVVSNLSEILETDLNCEFELPHYTFIGGKEKSLKLKDIITRLEKVYCHHIGLEFVYLNSTEKIQFLRKRFETPGASDLSNDIRKRILKRLTKAVVFELFVVKKWPKSKRLGLEGAETLIPGIKQVIDRINFQQHHTSVYEAWNISIMMALNRPNTKSPSTYVKFLMEKWTIKDKKNYI